MDSLEFLESVWVEQGLSSGAGYAFLSFKDKDGGWQDLAFRYGKDEIEIPDAEYGDVYFCPNLFAEGRRRKGTMLRSCWLYADLDTVVPGEIAGEFGRILEPTCAWETSEGRFQGMWLLDTFLGEKDHNFLNKQMTYQLGADKGGWDSTQVLRVPGTVNHKYEEKPEVKLLWTL